MEPEALRRECDMSGSHSRGKCILIQMDSMNGSGLEGKMKKTFISYGPSTGHSRPTSATPQSLQFACRLGTCPGPIWAMDLGSPGVLRGECEPASQVSVCLASYLGFGAEPVSKSICQHV